jgi:protein TonB
MKTKFLMLSCGLLVFASACNNSSETKATDADTAKAMAKDTVAAVPPAPVEAAPAAIDSAAVTQAYLSAQKKSKKTAPPAAKKQGKEEVIMYSEDPIPSHEALEQPVATKATPAPARVVHTTELVYFIPSENPKFPGGDAALKAFIKKNLVYPEDALNYHVEGTVYADVYLDSLGYVKDVQFPAKHVGSGLEEETKTILMASPRWMPAKQNGVPVKSKITVPVVYKLKH